ncbi:hypothetical protein Bca4012_057547 [Brassica carinata]
MVLLYRFSLEIEKAKNSLDLNLGPGVETGDHIVPSVARPVIVDRVDGDRVRMNTANVYALTTVKSADFRPIPTGRHIRTSVPSHTYDPQFCSPHFGSMEGKPEYWESLMSSSYAVQVQRIYGVPGSEYVGYGPNDLNIVPSNVPSFPRNQNPIQVSSTGSSTDVKTIAETGTEVNFYKIEPTGLGNQVYRERGESSRQVNLATAEEVATEKNTDNIEQAHGDEGNNGGENGEA